MGITKKNDLLNKLCWNTVLKFRRFMIHCMSLLASNIMVMICECTCNISKYNVTCLLMVLLYCVQTNIQFNTTIIYISKHFRLQSHNTKKFKCTNTQKLPLLCTLSCIGFHPNQWTKYVVASVVMARQWVHHISPWWTPAFCTNIQTFPFMRAIIYKSNASYSTFLLVHTQNTTQRTLHLRSRFLNSCKVSWGQQGQKTVTSVKKQFILQFLCLKMSQTGYDILLRWGISCYEVNPFLSAHK